MDAKLLAQFRNRWKNVERIELSELRKMSFEEKLLKTVSAMQLGLGLGYKMNGPTVRDIQKVRYRWITLKNLLT